MSLKELLKQSITSHEQFSDLLLKASGYNTYWRPGGSNYENIMHARDGGSTLNVMWERAANTTVPFGALRDLRGSAVQPAEAWWVWREHARVLAGVYEFPELLRPIAQRFPELAVHCRLDKKDGTVFYTPDANYGQRDRQVDVAIGRLLRRLYPHLSDSAIQDFDAALRAELNDELEILPGDQIADAYIGCAADSCMTYKRGYWGHPLHPTEVYNAPGFGMAVMRRGDKQINARCLVWVNPDDANDKRMIRPYGDAALVRKLKRHGFKPHGLAGTRILRVSLEQYGYDKNVVLMPYLDSKSQEDKVGVHVVADEDPRYLRVINTHETRALATIDMTATGGQTTSGHATLHEKACYAALLQTCYVTGERFSLTTETGRKALIDGEMRVVGPAGFAKLLDQGWCELNTMRGGQLSTALYPKDTPSFCTPQYWVSLVDDEATRIECGYVRLAPEFYPDDKTWHLDSDSDVVFDSEARLILAVDAVDTAVMVNGAAERRIIHKSQVPTDARPIQRIVAKRPFMITPDVKTVRIKSGRTCVPGVHNIGQTWNGVWDYADNLVEKTFMYRTVLVEEGATPDHAALAAHFLGLVKHDRALVTADVRDYMTPRLGNFLAVGASGAEQYAVAATIRFISTVLSDTLAVRSLPDFESEDESIQPAWNTFNRKHPEWQQRTVRRMVKARSRGITDEQIMTAFAGHVIVPENYTPGWAELIKLDLYKSALAFYDEMHSQAVEAQAQREVVQEAAVAALDASEPVRNDMLDSIRFVVPSYYTVTPASAVVAVTTI